MNDPILWIFLGFALLHFAASLLRAQRRKR